MDFWWNLNEDSTWEQYRKTSFPSIFCALVALAKQEQIVFELSIHIDVLHGFLFCFAFKKLNKH